MKLFNFNPIYNKYPSGPSIVEGEVCYTLRTLKSLGKMKISFCWGLDGERETETSMHLVMACERYYHYEIKIAFEKVGLYWYYFKLRNKNQEFFLEKNNAFDVSETDNVLYPFAQLVIKEEQEVENFKDGVIYHIFVDRFNKSGEVLPREGLILENDWNKPVEKDEGHVVANKVCYGGNFRGIKEKLTYLLALNVRVIYLSPIFEAHSNHKYDTANYNKIDEMFGGETEFLELIEECKKLNIGVIIDGVFNHTGSDSIYFNKLGRYEEVGAYQSRDSKYFNWYNFTDYPDEYESWWGIKTLPQTVDTVPSFVSHICSSEGVVQKWMRLGLSGIRLDVVDELNDKFLTQISNSIKTVKKDALIVGEVWEEASTKVAYSQRRKYFLDGQLNSVTNYPLKNAIINFVKYADTVELKNVLFTLLDQYPKSIRQNLMNILCTHDTARILTVLGANIDKNSLFNKNIILQPDEYIEAIKLLKMATLILYTLFGIPTIFYGDEAGLQGAADPFCRSPYPWGNEDKELRMWYTFLGEMRKNELFSEGEFKLIMCDDGVLVYERFLNNKKAIIAVNCGEREYFLQLENEMTDVLTATKFQGRISLSRGRSFLLML